MVRDNTRLVTHIARQFRSPIGLEELIAEGMLGLVEGARRFDATRSVKASTYVAHWIRAYIARRVKRESGCAGSNHQRKLFWGIRRAFKAVADQDGRATAENIAAFLNIPVEIVQAFARHLVQGELRLDAPAFDGDGESVGDRLLVQGHTAEDDAIDAEERGRVHEAMQELSERERFV